MKQIAYLDENGYKRVSLIRDNDRDEMAHKGIPVLIPDVNRIDWEAVKRDLHNELVNREIRTIKDISIDNDGINGAILFALRSKLVSIYRED